MSQSQGSHRAARRGWLTLVAPPTQVAAPRVRAAEPRTVRAPAPARSVHDRLTIAVGMRRTGSAQVVHDPTVVDRRFTTVHRLSHAADRRAADAGAVGVAAGRHRRVARGRESLRRLVPQALILVLLTGGTAAFLMHDKSVTLSIDGRPRVLHTFADDVGELLADEGVTIGARDSVAPAPGTPLDDGDEVAVRYGAGAGFRPANGRRLSG